MKRVWNYIGTRQFAIFLLVVTTSVILLSNLLPNLNMMTASEADKLLQEKPLIYALSTKYSVGQLTKTWYFQAIPLFIFFSITACSLKRIKAELERRETPPSAPDALEAKYSIEIGKRTINRESLIEMLRSRGWKIIDAEGILYAVKGGRGIWGSFIFHAGMNIVLLGILISFIMAFDGRLLLTEGFPASTPRDIISGRNTGASDFPLTEIMLESFAPEFAEGGFPLKYTCSILGIGNDRKWRRYLIDANQPMRAGDYKLIFTKGGFAPRFIIKRRNGDVIADAVVNMNITMPEIADYFEAPEEGIKIKTELFPDYYQEGGQHKTRGTVPKNPVLFVEIKKGGKIIGKGFLHKGRPESFDDYTIEFADLKYWVSLAVSKDLGLSVIVLGFVLISSGLSARFVLNERRLWIIINTKEEGTVLGLGGKTRYFPALFDESLSQLSEDMRLLVNSADRP